MESDLMVLINQFGPLPITVTFNAPADGPASLFLSGSAWTESASTMLQLAMTLDGNPVMNTAPTSVMANQANTHMTLPAVFIPINLTAGEHTLTLLNGNFLVITDTNDFFHVSLHL